MIRKLKTIVRKNIREKGITFKKFEMEKYLLSNVFNTNHAKTVLICHFTPAYTHSLKQNHTVYAEAMSIGETFNELQYNVDVVDYGRWLAPNEIDIDKYDLFFGQGDSFESIFHYDTKNKLKLRYCTGMSIMTSNRNSIARIQAFAKRHGKLLVSSGVIVNAKTNIQMNFSDYFLFWGNQWGISTFTNDYPISSNRISTLPAFFYQTQKVLPKTGKDFLWMGSVGCIHRGLDWVLEYFIQHPEYTFHICGNVQNETEFFEFYQNKLTPNIHFHGFVDVGSSFFGQLLQRCYYQIYLSAGEGTSASVLTGVGNGALLPIVSQECCFDHLGHGQTLSEINIQTIDKAIKNLYSLSDEEFQTRSKALHEHVNTVHTIKNYKKTLKETLQKRIIEHQNK